MSLFKQTVISTLLQLYGFGILSVVVCIGGGHEEARSSVFMPHVSTRGFALCGRRYYVPPSMRVSFSKRTKGVGDGARHK